MSLLGVKKGKGKEVSKDRGLVDIVLSWSFQDVLNKDLYKDQVHQIPETFTSDAHYRNSFFPALEEETRADLASSMDTLSSTPFSQVIYVEEHKAFNPTDNLLYNITLKQTSEMHSKGELYEPEYGDIIALTDVKPKFIDDLNRPMRPYVIGLVEEIKMDEVVKGYELKILSSKIIEVGLYPGKKSATLMYREKQVDTLFAVRLTNLTTNIRIWNALAPKPGGIGMDIINKVIQNDPTDTDDCAMCSSGAAAESPSSLSMDIASFHLNKSQESAVMSCIAKSCCSHQTSVKMIWGPPGTGKTKTVACLLYSLLKMKYKTLTCAPTNIAVVEVAARVLKIVSYSFEHESCGIGDILLFGNPKRMKVNEESDLLDIFLQHRVDMLKNCLVAATGWNASLASMICLLEDPEKLYDVYLMENTFESDESDREEGHNNGNGKNVVDKCTSRNTKNIWKEKTTNKDKQKTKSAPEHKKHPRGKNRDSPSNRNKGPEAEDKKEGRQWTFEEFFKKRFKSIGDQLKSCIVQFCTHLPTSFLSLRAAEKMTETHNLLNSYWMLLSSINEGEGFGRVLKGVRSRAHKSSMLHEANLKCLQSLRLLPQKIQIGSNDENSIRMFCLANACLLFCTASGSAKLQMVNMKQQVQMLVIDEAAQLKECESLIPLQLSGLRHAILFGDERQLSAMVTSEEAQFGRSLFERFEKLGWKKHLLNIQYRMHPSISLFPNREFYNNQILDAPNVKEASYHRRFLKENMFGSYSFINIGHGQEELHWKSRRNMVEVAVIDDIVERLREEIIGSEKKLRIGVISPYKAQVKAIEERIGKYSADFGGDFSVNVRSVDGFQGGEEDVIIISTVRCNRAGNVGFLSNEQRTNVALTRARHCLWILGNEPTLARSRSIWKKLVDDAKGRRCYFNAEDDKRLSCAITVSLFELGLLNSDSILFRDARWKIILCDDFLKSLKKVRYLGNHKGAIYVLQKLADGWRPSRTKGCSPSIAGTSAMLLEHCRINDHLMLIWSVDILGEDRHQTQVMRMWNILPPKDMEGLAKNLETIFSEYSTEKMQFCLYKCMERNLVVPMQWPETRQATGRRGGVHGESDSSRLSRQLAAFSLNGNNHAATNATTHNSTVIRTRWQPKWKNCSEPDLIG